MPWGCGADEKKLEQILKADTDKKIKAVAVVHNETTTGVTSDIKQVREVSLDELFCPGCDVSSGDQLSSTLECDGRWHVYND